MFTIRHSHPFSMANIVFFFITTKKNAFFHPNIHTHARKFIALTTIANKLTAFRSAILPANLSLLQKSYTFAFK